MHPCQNLDLHENENPSMLITKNFSGITIHRLFWCDVKLSPNEKLHCNDCDWFWTSEENSFFMFPKLIWILWCVISMWLSSVQFLLCWSIIDNLKKRQQRKEECLGEVEIITESKTICTSSGVDWNTKNGVTACASALVTEVQKSQCNAVVVNCKHLCGVKQNNFACVLDNPILMRKCVMFTWSHSLVRFKQEQKSVVENENESIQIKCSFLKNQHHQRPKTKIWTVKGKQRFMAHLALVRLSVLCVWVLGVFAKSSCVG